MQQRAFTGKELQQWWMKKYVQDEITLTICGQCPVNNNRPPSDIGQGRGSLQYVRVFYTDGRSHQLDIPSSCISYYRRRTSLIQFDILAKSVCGVSRFGGSIASPPTPCRRPPERSPELPLRCICSHIKQYQVRSIDYQSNSPGGLCQTDTYARICSHYSAIIVCSTCNTWPVRYGSDHEVDGDTK